MNSTIYLPFSIERIRRGMEIMRRLPGEFEKKMIATLATPNRAAEAIFVEHCGERDAVIFTDAYVQRGVKSV